MPNSAICVNHFLAINDEPTFYKKIGGESSKNVFRATEQAKRLFSVVVLYINEIGLSGP